MEKQLRYTIRDNDKINRFLVGPETVSAVKTEYSTLTHEISSHCRLEPFSFPAEKFFQENRRPEKNCPDWEEHGQEIYWPLTRSGYERDSFNPVQGELRSRLRFSLEVQKEFRCCLEIKNNAAISVFHNGQLIQEVDSLHRSDCTTTEVYLDLKPGMNNITVSLDAYLERENFLRIEITYRAEFSAELILHCKEDPTKLLTAESLLSNMLLDKDHFDDEDLVFSTETPPTSDVPIEVLFSGDLMDFVDEATFKGVWKSGETSFQIPQAFCSEQFGFNSLVVNLLVGDHRLSKVVACEIYSSEFQNLPSEHSLEERKKSALKFIAKYVQSTIQKLIASAASDQDVPDRDFVMQTQSEFIASEGDCGDFFFVPLLLFYLKFPDSFSDKESEQLLQLALNWRYWIDEPGNDTRWYFSENHAICFHTAQLLAGEIWPDEIFVRSGCKGKLQSRTASSRISKWLDNFEKHGLLEWNSMSYIPIDLIALFGIFMSEDKELASRAKSSLDEVFSILATTHYAGEISSSQGRVYPRDIKARRSQETTFLSWIAWGQGYVNKHALATTLFAISDYSPPPELARQAKPSGSDFRSCTILDDTKIVQLRAPHFSMSSACNYMSGNPGYQEHIFHLNLGRDPKACLFLNHPGSTDPGSIRRPGFWVGNGILPYVNQLDNTVFVYYDLPDDCPIGFTQLYCPENVFDRIETSDHGITIAHRGAYCAIRTLQTISPPSHSDVKNSHLRQYGNQTAWIVHAASEGNYESFESYREELMSPAFDRFWKFSGLSSL